jgi:hypothetical protein
VRAAKHLQTVQHLPSERHYWAIPQDLCVCGWPLRHHPEGVPANADYLNAIEQTRRKRGGAR